MIEPDYDISKSDKKRMFKDMEALLKHVFGERLECGAFDIKKPERFGYSFYCGFITGKIYYDLSLHEEYCGENDMYVVIIYGPNKEELLIGDDDSVIALRETLEKFLKVIAKETAATVEMVERTFPS